MLLITTPNVKSETRKIINAAQGLGWAVYNDSWRIPDRLKTNTDIAIYGEWLFCETVAEQTGYKLQRNPLNWLAKLPEEYVNRKVVFTNLGEARRLTERKFIKPADNKLFQAKIYNSGSELTNSLEDNIPVLISDVMSFTSEYRCIVKNRQVISSCCYWLHTKQMQNLNQAAELNLSKNYDNKFHDVVNFVNKMLKDDRVECVNSCTIDVGRFDKDRYTIIEENPIYASGIYGCDPVAMLDAIKSSCIRESN
jgi:hypothetical protein